MAQTLLSANISGVYDKLLFQKGDRKLYYSNTSGDADAEFTNVILSSNVTLNASGEKLFLSGSSNSTNYLSDTTLQTAHASGLTVTATAGPLVFNSEEGVSFKLDSNNDGTEFFNILNIYELIFFKVDFKVFWACFFYFLNFGFCLYLRHIL